MGVNDHITNRYDRSKGWSGTNPGWYEVILYVDEPSETIIKYTLTVDWIKENIQGHYKHCLWMYAGNYLKYKFRYERDYLWFKLRWG